MSNGTKEKLFDEKNRVKKSRDTVPLIWVQGKLHTVKIFGEKYIYME
jgi:hypothetical protein